MEKKSFATKELFGIDNDTYKEWLEIQMTPEMIWMNIEINHVKPIQPFNVSNDDDELKKAFNRKNKQPLLKELHFLKGLSFVFLEYQLHIKKAHQFLRLNEEGYKQEFY